MNKIQHISSNETVIKIGKGFGKILNNRLYNSKYGNKLYIQLKSMHNESHNQMLSFVSRLLDIYKIEFKEYLLTDTEFKEFVTLMTEDDESLIIIKNSIIGISSVA